VPTHFGFWILDFGFWVAKIQPALACVFGVRASACCGNALRGSFSGQSCETTDPWRYDVDYARADLRGVPSMVTCACGDKSKIQNPKSKIEFLPRPKRLTTSGFSAIAGMSLVEVMVVMTILTLVMAVLFSLSTSMGDTARVQGAKITSSDQARRGMIYTTRDLRQAANSTISALPAAAISYRVAVDLDGNGSAVDVGANIELSGVHQIERDLTDANGDGITSTQLVLEMGGAVQVLANDLAEDEDTNGNGVLDTGEDRNLNGRLDRGVWFEREGSAVRVTIQAEGHSRQGHLIQSSLTQTVFPRN